MGFEQPLGTNVEPGSVRGYHLDMRVKATAPSWPSPEGGVPGRALWVETCQWGLGAFEHWLATGDERWLAAAVGVGEELCSAQGDDGGWRQLEPYPHTFDLRPPWLSAMAQGEGASLLVRLHAETGEQRFADAARGGVLPLFAATDEGGLRTALGEGWFLEEYPTSPPSCVLNGGIFALWGLHDVGLALADERASAAFGEGVGHLADNLHRWDLGWWTRYDLFPHRLVNVASIAYQELHADQLEATAEMSGRPALREASGRYRRQLRSGPARVRAVARKVAFRAAVPRR
jgi:hypothetical protein